MKIEKNVVAWFTKMFSRPGNVKWLYPDGDSIWEKVGQTVTMVRGNPLNRHNQKTALHISAAGYTVKGVQTLF
jgi:hypothetical protein